MANRRLPTHNLLIIFLLSSSIITLTTSSNNDFIKSACKATHYEPTCIDSLSPYGGRIGSSDRELAHMSLIVSFLKCRSLSQSLKQFNDEGANGDGIKRCLKVMSGTLYHLIKAVRELESVSGSERSRGEEFFKVMSSVQHHVNSAINSQDKCADALRRDDFTWKVVIQKMVEEANQCTANALALVDSYSVVGGGGGIH